MKPFLLCSLVLPFLFLMGCGASQSLRSDAGDVDDLHRSIVTIDTHADTPIRFMRGDYDPAQRHDSADEGGKIDFPRMKQGGLDGVFFVAWIPQGPRTPAGNERARADVTAIIDTIHAVLDRNHDAVSLALASADIARIKAEGKRAVYIGIENGYALGNDLTLVKKIYDRGIRYITLCHSRNDDICDSSTDPDTMKYNGLSSFGKSVIREMNAVGMIVDVSHASDKAFYDVLAVSAVPVIASHSCTRALCNTPRNMDDAMLKAIAANGGVVQVSLVSEFVKTLPDDPVRDSTLKALRVKYGNREHPSAEQRSAMNKERTALNKLHPRVLPTVSDVVDHIDHIIAVAGIDHVGIGTDFDGGGEVHGCTDVREMKNITAELLRRGYSHDEIRKIWGGNFLRVFSRVEEYAQHLRGERN
jgi:membrane dipeptidase